MEVLAVSKACYVTFLLHVYTGGTFDSPGLPPGFIRDFCARSTPLPEGGGGGGGVGVGGVTADPHKTHARRENVPLLWAVEQKAWNCWYWYVDSATVYVFTIIFSFSIV